MKKFLSVILSTVFLLLVVFIPVNPSDNVDAAENAVINISLETNVSGYLTPNTMMRYKFTAQSTGFYIVETAGSTDTYGIVRTHGTNPISYYDDDDGYGSNFCIGFYQEAGTYSNILVRHHNFSTGTGPYTVRIRRQKAKIYTNQYPNLNTYPQEATPLIRTQQMGYDSFIFHDKTPTFLTTTDFVYNNINCDVFFFSGHGNKGSIECVSGGTFSSFDLQNNYNYSMSTTKLALWNACYSAVAPDNGNDPSIMAASHNAGAECAIGWNGSFNAASAKIWTDTFFTSLAQGETILSSCQAGNNALTWPNDSCKDKWRYSGNPYIVLTNAAVFPRGVNNNAQDNDCLSTALQSSLQNYKFIEYDLSGGGKRYFKTINGYLTDDFYDLKNNGTIKKSISSFSTEEIMLIESQLNDLGLIESNREITDDNQIIIIKYNNTPTIVSVEKKISNINGYENVEISCHNMVTGESIDYSDMVEAKYI